MTTFQPIKIYDPDYEPNRMEDDEMIFKIKQAIQELRPVERKIFLTYTEGGTYTAVAKTYNVSVPTARTYVHKIIEKILTIVNDTDNEL